MKVNFMVIGAQKCGTTSMAAQLAAHPQICFCRDKEPGYFHKTVDWESGLDQYHALFDPLPGQLCGEASTFYTFFPEFRGTHERLYAYNPSLKLIYLVRQPVERVISHYTHNYVREIEKLPPDSAVFRDPSYVDRSRYGVQIRPYLERFGAENVLLLVFEEYIADQLATLRRIAAFLGIDPIPFAEADTEPQHQSVGQPYLRSATLRSVSETSAFQQLRTLVPASIRQPLRRRWLSNTVHEKPYFSPQTRQALWQLLVDDVQTVEALLGRRLDAWRDGYTNLWSNADDDDTYEPTQGEPWVTGV